MEPVVQVQQGTIRGKVCNDFLGGKYYSFQGIPYAKPPLGDLRFKAPQPPEPWDGIKECTKDGSECLSRDFLIPDVVGTEDCLYLNVYTPEISKKDGKLKPVMFWIHGGGFISGSSNSNVYGADYLITEDIVLVTINYRLHVFGFLHLEDPSLGVPGNNGFKDMVMGLKWVQQNIRNFNGDPNNVTIFGESAGGAATHLLTLSPMTKGLIHKAIIQSGCALNIWTSADTSAKDVAGYMGFESNDEKEILKFMKSVSAEKLLEAQLKSYNGIEADQPRAFGFVVEKPTNEPAFLLEHPIDIMRKGKQNKIPIMIGYCSNEGMFADFWYKALGVDFKPVIENFETKVPFAFKLPKGSEMSLKMASMLKNFYFNGKDCTPDMAEKFYELESDRFFVRGIQKTVKLHISSAPEIPIYLYRFSVDAELNILKKLGELKQKGASHFDEIGYLFKTAYYPNPPKDSFEHTTILRMIKLWTNFAKTSNPTPNQDQLLNVTWKPVTQTSLCFVDIGEKLEAGVDPEKERMKFWDEIAAVIPAAKDM